MFNLTSDLLSELPDIEPPASFELPKDALLINGRLGEQFEFIRCNGGIESRVYYFNTWNWNISVSNNSNIDWLNNWCNQAEQAITSGYYEQDPNGTIP